MSDILKRLKSLKSFAVDVDGSLTDGYYHVSESGIISKSFNTKDFYALHRMKQLGYDILKYSDLHMIKAAAIVAHEHHEKYNGKGYPRQLKGESIHIYGRITALADVFDALGSERVYKKKWEDEDIFTFLEKERGEHFDPKLVDLFFEHKDKFLAIRDEFVDVIVQIQ